MIKCNQLVVESSFDFDSFGVEFVITAVSGAFHLLWLVMTSLETMLHGKVKEGTMCYIHRLRYETLTINDDVKSGNSVATIKTFAIIISAALHSETGLFRIRVSCVSDISNNKFNTLNHWCPIWTRSNFRQQYWFDVPNMNFSTDVCVEFSIMNLTCLDIGANSNDLTIGWKRSHQFDLYEVSELVYSQLKKQNNSLPVFSASFD